MKLTQEQLAALIAQVYSNLVAKGKTDNFTNEDIMSELDGILAATGGDDAVEDDKGGGDTGLPEINADFIKQVLDAMKSCQKSADDPSADDKCDDASGMKGADGPSDQKSAVAPPAAPPAQAAPASAAPAPAQRKYSNLFLSKGTSRGSASGTGGSAFKSRIASMNERDRRKAVFGAFGRAVKCIHASGGEAEKASFIAERRFGDSEMAGEFKALSATVPSAGGYLIPEVYADEVIELLYPATVIYDLGARRLGMANGNLNIPKIRAGARAMYVGENRKIPKSDPKFGNLKLSAKKLTALIPMSNDLLKSTNFDNDVIVGQDVTRQMALGVDWGAFMGTGDEFQPLGILNNKRVRNIDVTKLGTEYASADGKLTAMFPNYMVASVLKNNVFADGLGFVFNTSVEQFYKSLRDNVGGFIFADEMNDNHTLAGYPYRTTNLFETTDKGKTKMVFGNWNDLIIGEQGALEIETSREGAWTDDAGNIVSAFENDQTIIRAINHVDTGLRHEESFVVATEISVPV